MYFISSGIKYALKLFVLALLFCLNPEANQNVLNDFIAINVEIKYILLK